MSTNTDTYNGWANRETWAVNLWINNDEGLYSMARERRLDDGDDWKAFVSELYDMYLEGEAPGLASMFNDIGSLWRVEWNDIADAWNEE